MNEGSPAISMSWRHGATVRLRPESVAWRQVNNEIVALEVEESVYLGVNTTGAIVWRALAEGASAAALAGLLTNAFDVDESRAAQDVAKFLGHLEDRDLIEVVER